MNALSIVIHDGVKWHYNFLLFISLLEAPRVATQVLTGDIYEGGHHAIAQVLQATVYVLDASIHFSFLL